MTELTNETLCVISRHIDVFWKMYLTHCLSCQTPPQWPSFFPEVGLSSSLGVPCGFYTHPPETGSCKVTQVNSHI